MRRREARQRIHLVRDERRRLEMTELIDSIPSGEFKVGLRLEQIGMMLDLMDEYAIKQTDIAVVLDVAVSLVTRTKQRRLRTGVVKPNGP